MKIIKLFGIFLSNAIVIPEIYVYIYDAGLAINYIHYRKWCFLFFVPWHTSMFHFNVPFLNVNYYVFHFSFSITLLQKCSFDWLECQHSGNNGELFRVLEFFLDLSNIRRNNLLKERKQKILIIQTATSRAATKNMGCNMGHPFFVCNSNNISFSAHTIQMVLNYVLV